MTDKEIIKALECCSLIENPNGELKCKQCPFNGIFCGTGKEKITAKKIVIDLINRQQAEKKELKTENLILSQKRFNIFERIEFTDKLKKQAKAEAIKEFAENIKLEFYKEFDEIIPSIMADKIDNLVKEMVGK